jgi:hypothetical protein
VSDWQRGGDHDQKVRRGRRLKEWAAELPPRFRECYTTCFRQEAHQKDRTWQLLADGHLLEEIASWTTDLDVAKRFKGGVPPPGLRGLIFSIMPPAEAVVLNLNTLFADLAFCDAVETHRPNVTGFGDGIGRWRESQREVVLELLTIL